MASLQRNSVDILSKIRRLGNTESLQYKVGIILNDDGTVFDKVTKKQFRNVVDWSKEYQNAL